MTILVLPLPAWPPAILALSAMTIWSVAWVTCRWHHGVDIPATQPGRHRADPNRVERHRAVEDAPHPEPRLPAVDELAVFHEGHDGRPTAGCPGCEAVETAGASA